VPVGALVCMHCGHRFIPMWVRVLGLVLFAVLVAVYWFYLRDPFWRWLGW